MDERNHGNLEWIDYLDLCGRVAREAALSIASGKGKNVTHDLERDVKVGADKLLNDFIVKRLTQETPYPVLSEEEDTTDLTLAEQGYRWIVDPLDGSLNFSRSLPLCCISIGFWKGGEPILGVICDFNHDEIFSGLVGRGAWLNGKLLKVSKVVEKKRAILCTGFPVLTDFSDSALLKFIRDIQIYKKVRLLGSAALSLAYVAAGRTDVYQEKDIAIWDVAAGIAIVIGAGGVVQFKPSEIRNRLIVRAASNDRLFEDL